MNFTMPVNAPVPPNKKTGLIPRNYSTHPVGYLSCLEPFPDSLIIPQGEWQSRFDLMRQQKSGLLDLRQANYDALKSLDQNGFGLCWAFSSTKATMYTRAIAGEPVFPLSAWYVAGNIKGWRDEGGWGAASLEFITKNGVPAMDKCPKYSPSVVAPDAAQNAALHKVTEWWDGSDNPDTAQQQLVSCLLCGIPCVVDLNVMSHSMCAIDIDKLNPLTIIYDNSWGEQGDHGLYRGTGAYARPDGLVIPRVSRASLT